jgi:hypothetical protein
LTNVTNSLIVSKAPDVFDNLGAYQVPMAGRQEELQGIIQNLELPEPTVTVVSAPLGSGKTFLLNQCFGTLLPRGFDDNRNRYTVFASREKMPDRRKVPLAKEISSRLNDADTRFRRICIVEELDRKSKFPVLESVLSEALGWLESDPTGSLILTGDRFLEHPTVTEQIAATKFPRKDVSLAPLDRELMLEAIALRVNQIVLKRDSSFESALPAAEALLSDPLVESCVIPATAPGIANFREAFGLMRRMSDHVDLDVSGIDFGRRFLRRLTSERDLLAGQRRTEEIVLERVRRSLLSGTPVSEISLESLLTSSGSEYTEADYRKSVVDSLVRLRCLVPMGVPYLVDSSVSGKNVGPYLPKQDVFVDIAAELSADYA